MEQFKKASKKPQSENRENSKEEEKENTISAPYEDPKVYFLKVLFKNLPSTNSKSEKCEEMFNLLTTLVKMTSSLFIFTDPYGPQPENEDIDSANIFSSNSVFETCINEIEKRPTLEERHSDYEDRVLGGFLNLAQTILQIAPKLRKYAGDEEKGYGLTKKLFNFLFEMPKIENKEANVPKFKAKATRKKAFNLLICLCQNHEESGTKHQINENYYSLFKELYLYHKEMDEIEKNTSVNVDDFDYDVGIKSSIGYAGLKNFGATCYQNSVIQQLFMISDLRYGIMASDVDSKNKIMSTLFQLQLIFANLQETEKKYFTPRDFSKTFKIDGAPVDVRVQQDAQEFFNVILDNIENQLKGTTNENLLKEIIGGEICNEVKSLESEHKYVSQTMEPFFSVQLDIKNRK